LFLSKLGDHHLKEETFKDYTKTNFDELSNKFMETFNDAQHKKIFEKLKGSTILKILLNDALTKSESKEQFHPII
jgi:hypothetical protein